MNKQELVQAVGSTIAKVDDVLKAMRLRTDADDYSDTSVEPIKEAIALMDTQKISAKDALKQLKQKSQLAASSNGAIASDSTVTVENMFEIPTSVQEGIDGVVRDVFNESIVTASERVVDRTEKNGENAIKFLVGRVDQICADELTNQISSPAFLENIRKAIELGKQKRSQKPSD